MSKPKRVSLKGKGAAIFFGDYTPTPRSQTNTNQEPQQQSTIPSQQAPPPDNQPSILSSQDSFTKPDEPTKRRTDEAANRRTGDTTKGRIIKRQSMDFYQDQLETLSDYQAMEKLEGRRVGMSQMIREALDDYIEKKKLKK